MNWFEAVEYCFKIGKRLPSEWECAARSGNTTKFIGERKIPSCTVGLIKTQPIGQKKPNSYGLFDMAGNVWEWTNSHCESAQGKVLRGGSWRNSMNAMQSFKWITSLPIHRFHYVGFRCVSSKLPVK
jgi:formylglycine-generating enzyme required for sulfatase activity